MEVNHTNVHLILVRGCPKLVSYDYWLTRIWQISSIGVGQAWVSWLEPGTDRTQAGLCHWCQIAWRSCGRRTLLLGKTSEWSSESGSDTFLSQAKFINYVSLIYLKFILLSVECPHALEPYEPLTLNDFDTLWEILAHKIIKGKELESNHSVPVTQHIKEDLLEFFIPS